MQKQSTTIDFVDQIEKIPLNKVFKATDFFWADYDAIWYGSTKFQYGDFEVDGYSKDNDEDRDAYFLQDSFLDTKD